MTPPIFEHARRPVRTFQAIAAETGFPRSTVYRIYRQALLKLEINYTFIPRRAPRRRKEVATA